jgi:hypothetical protein
MATTRIIDLDKLAAPPIEVLLDGKKYKLPGDIPMELFLAMKQGEEAAEGNAIEDMEKQVIALFQIHQPKMTTLPSGLGMTQMFQVIPAVYFPGSIEPDESAEGNGSAPIGSKKSPSKRGRPRKASSSPS